MKARYDPDADAMYIRVKNGKSHVSKEIDENTIIDLDENGDLIGIELLFVKKRKPWLIKELEARKIIAA